MPEKTNSNNPSSRKLHTSLTNKNNDNVKIFNDEETIDIYGLLLNVWRYKLLILFVTFIFSIISYIYVSQLKNIYKVQSYLLPPLFSNSGSIDLNKLANSGSIDLNKLAKGYRENFSDIHNKFKHNLKSRKIQKLFLFESGLFEKLKPKIYDKSMDAEILNNFHSMIKIKDAEFFSVSIESHDPVFSAKIINDFIDFINFETVKTQKLITQRKINEAILDIEYAISSKRKMAKKRRRDQILRFQEAKIIAKSLGFERRVDATNIIQSTSKANTDITAATTPLYYIGTQALNAEISILKNRVSDDPFIPGLRDLQDRIGFLKTIDLEKLNLDAVLIDQKAYAPKLPIRPNRKLIILSGTTMGLFFGLILTTIITIIKKNYEYRKKIINL